MRVNAGSGHMVPALKSEMRTEISRGIGTMLLLHRSLRDRGVQNFTRKAEGGPGLGQLGTDRKKNQSVAHFHFQIAKKDVL